LVSKKLTGIRLVSIEPEIGRETAAEAAKAFQQFVAPGLACHADREPLSRRRDNIKPIG
jgi:hypothetical protein